MTAVQVVHGTGVRAGYGTRDGYTGGWLGGLYRVPTQQPALLEESAVPSEAGPVRPCRGLEWVGNCARTYGGRDGS